MTTARYRYDSTEVSVNALEKYSARVGFCQITIVRGARGRAPLGAVSTVLHADIVLQLPSASTSIRSKQHGHMTRDKQFPIAHQTRHTSSSPP